MLEHEFQAKVALTLAQRINPLYITLELLFASVWAYFLVGEQPQCYFREGQVLALAYSDTTDVTRIFYWLTVASLFAILSQAVLHHLQIIESYAGKLRAWQVISNFIFLSWFVAVLFFRFSEAGRACSGDFVWADENGLPDESKLERLNKEGLSGVPSYDLEVIMPELGSWMLVYLLLQSLLFLVCKVIQVVLSNNLEAEFEEKRA